MVLRGPELLQRLGVERRLWCLLVVVGLEADVRLGEFDVPVLGVFAQVIFCRLDLHLKTVLVSLEAFSNLFRELLLRRDSVGSRGAYAFAYCYLFIGIDDRVDNVTSLIRGRGLDGDPDPVCVRNDLKNELAAEIVLGVL